ncbi:hypothetical protein EHS25_000485 [Saitozyma podzolica]|uniref:Chalcone isomerase domain-containing protein n=1 Tax=Saitozyma podzolica TaxID=1890683 RepID=A0A427YW92_9TREE|nr:hypothetical protein EHS25_000485 [Saitozyma podzolica]
MSQQGSLLAEVNPVDTDTSIPFPLRLQLTAHVPPLSLVGLGVRKVSFLRVKVYSAGFYVDEKALAQLDRVPGFATYTPQHLLTVPPADGGPHLQGEALIRKLLEYPAPCAIRIVPTRKTDFAHLRDGFTRAIMARQKLAHQAGTLSHSDDHLINDAMHALKGLFPAHAIPKGKALVLYRTAKGALVVEYEGKELGKVDDPWMSRELFLAYFADKDVISPKLKEDVAKGFEHYVHAKIGPA